MEILNDTEEQKKPNNNRLLHDFPTSLLNFRIPPITKLIFFFTGWLGLNLIALFLSLIMQLTPYFDTETGNISPFGSSVYQFLVYLILACIFLGIIFFSKRKYYKDFWEDLKGGKHYIFVLYGFLGILLVNIVFNFIFSFVPFYGQNANQDTIEGMMGASPVLAFFMIVILGPFCEEMTYRLGLCDSLSKKSRWKGIILSAIFFGLIHFSIPLVINAIVEPTQGNIELMAIEFMNLPTYILSGIVLAFVYAKSGKISSSLGAHILVNLYSFVSFFILQAVNNSGATNTVVSFFLR